MRRLSVLFAALALVALPALAFATQPDPDHKVGICHRTASDTNPYVFITVDEAAVDTHLGNGQGHPAKTNEDGSPRNDFLADDESDCDLTVEATPTPVVEATPTIAATPTDTLATPSLPPTGNRPDASLPSTDTESDTPQGPAKPFLLLAILGTVGMAGFLILRFPTRDE